MTDTNVPYAALWPRGPRQAKIKPLAQRLDTLEGKTVAWIWDYVFRGNEVFEQLEQSLRERYPGVLLSRQAMAFAMVMALHLLIGK